MSEMRLWYQPSTEQLFRITEKNEFQYAPQDAPFVLASEADALIADLRLKLGEAQRRYTWAANELLACDYGDNDAPGEQVGWRVYGWRDRTGNRRIYGPSIDAAIDKAREGE